MRVLLINPNTSDFVTERAVEAATAVASSQLRIKGVTGTFGAPIINSEADIAIGGYSALELAANHATGFDAVGLAVSFDCGLAAVREVLSVPVVGLAEASVHQALRIGERFAVVSFGERTQPLYEKILKNYAQDSQIGGVNCISSLPASVLKDPIELQQQATKAVADTIEKYDCDSVVLLATAFAGLATDLDFEKPVIDCVEALSMTLLECKTNDLHAQQYKSQVFPEQKVLQGVSEGLRTRYQRFPKS